MAHLIGIDLGSYSVKMTVFEGSFGRYQLHSVFNQRLSEGSQPLMARQSEAISRILSGLHIQNPTFVSALSAQHATSRFLKLPFGDPAKIEQILPFQVEGVVPFDINEMIMTHRIVDLRGVETDAMACLASRDNVQQTLSELDAIGIDPKILPVDADVLTHFSQSGVEAIVDIGHSRCLCSLSIEGKGSAFRQISHGMSKLSTALANTQSIDISEAEEIMWMTDISVRAATVEDVDFSALYKNRDQLIQDIQTTLILFEDSTEVEIERVRICGGGASQKGMRALLEEALGVPVEVIQLPHEIQQQTPSSSSHALSFALSEIATGNSPIRVLDLRKDAFAFKGHLADLGRFIKFGSFAAIACMVLGVGWFSYRYIQLTNQISSYDDDIISQIQEAMPDIDPSLFIDSDTAYAFLQSEVIDSTEKMNKLGSIVAEEPPVLGLLKAISENLPAHKDARIDVSELNITDNAIVIKAQTDGFEDAAEMEAALQRYPKFRGAKKSNEEKGRRNQGIQFTITIPLEEEPTEEDI